MLFWCYYKAIREDPGYVPADIVMLFLNTISITYLNIYMYLQDVYQLTSLK